MMTATAKTDASRYVVHLVLFIVTCATTTFAGASYVATQAPVWTWPELWLWLKPGWQFSVPLLSILFAHEMGHYIAARIHRIDVSLPYFIPFPLSAIGTMGALIRIREPMTSPNALFDVGVAGPLAGLVVAIPVLAIGISLSAVHVVSGPAMVEGNSILYWLLKLLIKQQSLPQNNIDILLHPVAWAGWVGLLVTMINLIPIGQLDGGHIAYAYFRHTQNRASQWLHRILPIMAVGASLFSIFELRLRVSLSDAVAAGFSAGMPWLVWWGMLILMKRVSGGSYHAPCEDIPLTPGRRMLSAAMLVIFVLIFTPIPMRRWI